MRDVAKTELLEIGFGLMASIANDTSQKPTLTDAKIAKAHRTEFIDLSSEHRIGVLRL